MVTNECNKMNSKQQYVQRSRYRHRYYGWQDRPFKLERSLLLNALGRFDTYGPAGFFHAAIPAVEE